ncbi:MAG: NgoPII family restriction endonuclease [Chloroflexota bacterium]
MRNILTAIHDLVMNDARNVSPSFKENSNRINAVGDNLEEHIKNAFAGSLGMIAIEERLEKYNQTFSWTGNTNNPPDFMIQGGDAVEVKKIGGLRSQIQLNSSYPKKTLHADSPMITDSCRTSEIWSEKDLLYCIGSVQQRVLKRLWMIYGDCFVATAKTYTRVADAVTDGIINTGLELNKTNELARVNKVDPLGVTSLRVRGMWIVQHPDVIFRDHIYEEEATKSLHVLMLKAKFDSFPESDRQSVLALPDDSFSIRELKIPSPDNPANLMDAIYVTGVL